MRLLTAVAACALAMNQPRVSFADPDVGMSDINMASTLRSAVHMTVPDAAPSAGVGPLGHGFGFPLEAVAARSSHVCKGFPTLNDTAPAAGPGHQHLPAVRYVCKHYGVCDGLGQRLKVITRLYIEALDEGARFEVSTHTAPCLLFERGVCVCACACAVVNAWDRVNVWRQAFCDVTVTLCMHAHTHTSFAPSEHHTSRSDVKRSHTAFDALCADVPTKGSRDQMYHPAFACIWTALIHALHATYPYPCNHTPPVCNLHV